MITDIGSGNVIYYIPVTLVEGEETAPFSFRVTPQDSEDTLAAQASADAEIMARTLPGGVFAPLASNPIDLAPYAGAYVDIEIKVAAAPTLPGVTRFALFLGTVGSKQAGWNN